MNAAYCDLLKILFSSLTPATSARCLLCAFCLCPAHARLVSALNKDAQAAQTLRRGLKVSVSYLAGPSINTWKREGAVSPV